MSIMSFTHTHKETSMRLRPEATNSQLSGIGEVRLYGRGKDLIPLWVGEGDLPTPEFINQATIASLNKGETFYNYSGGDPALKEALATYASALYGRALGANRFFVTGSGMQALQVAFTLVAGVGDEVIVPTPAWPNAAGAIGVRGAKTVMVEMPFGNNAYKLDIERIAAAITPRTTCLFINTPANPTGTVATHQELRDILALARKHNLWIVADEIYTRFYWRDDGVRAPSFHDIREADDKIIFINSFSKNWAMTGYRLGWIEADAALGGMIENLIQVSTSGSPLFLQRAAIAALEQGEPFILHQIEKAKASRAVLSQTLKATGRVRMVEPDGAFYLFFKIDGFTDSRALAMRLIDEAGVGLAPGTAFGAGGEAFMRVCYLRDTSQVKEAAARLAAFIMKL
jgi:aspartate/methionine/tyrosine aminotransferase